jgi:hypothetical protein
MTLWETVAKQLGFVDEKSMWEKLYKEDSLADLATKFAVSPGQIRGRIDACGITLRTRGGANYQKITLSKEILDDVVTLGIRKAAIKHGVQPQTLYNRIYYKHGLTIGELKEMARAEAAKEQATVAASSIADSSEEDPTLPE